MNNFFEEVIKFNFDCETLNQNNTCANCGSNFSQILKNSKVYCFCLSCSFLVTPNKECFGMLTKDRAHSPSSLINSLFIFNEDLTITLVTTHGYAKAIPVNSILNVVVDDQEEYIINFLNEPQKSLLFKTNLRINKVVDNFVESDKFLISIITVNGILNIRVDYWNKLVKLAKTNEKLTMQKVLDIFEESSRSGSISDVEFIKENYVLFSTMSKYLDVLPHSKIYIIQLLRRVLNDI